MQLLQTCVATQFLCCDSISIRSCCNIVSYIVCILIATRKVCRDRVFSPLNLISCCSFILMLQHSLLVLWLFSVMTKFLCCDKTFFLQLIFVSRFSSVMSRQDLSSLCWNLCRDMEKSVATLFICVKIIFVSRP